MEERPTERDFDKNYFIDRLDRNERRLDKHSQEIDQLKLESAKLFAEIQHLTASINWLTKTIWAVVGFALFFFGNKILTAIFG